MPVFTISQVTSHVRSVLERDDALRDLWVRGEVSNLARPGSGHSYFSLRDGNSSLRCVMFRGSGGGVLLETGAAVIAHGRISVYEVRGDLQMIVDLVQPEGAGELQLRLEELKLKFEREGLLDPSRKRPLPPLPTRIGVVTSPTGAVLQDIRTVVERRYPLVELLLAPCAVQGEGAADTIVDAFEALNETPDVDLVILARGGGSMEDLQPFNEEPVGRAVYSSRAPVVSAVGHETDTTLVDFVADRRAATPSAAAELAVPDRSELRSYIGALVFSMDASALRRIDAASDSLTRLENGVDRNLPDLDTLRMGVDDVLRRAGTQVSHRLDLERGRIEGESGRLRALCPADTLRRGYAVVERSLDGRTVIDASHVSVGETVRVGVSKGSFEAEVSGVTA